MFNRSICLVVAGDIVYYIVYINDNISFVVPARITEVQYICTHPKHERTIWISERFDVKTGKRILENPCSNIDLEKDLSLKVENYYLWIDEPVGHGVQLWEGETCYGDDSIVFLDEESALKNLTKSEGLTVGKARQLYVGWRKKRFKNKNSKDSISQYRRILF